MYADDMQVYFALDVADDTFDTKVDLIMQDIKEFIDFRLLKLNEEKTEIILITGNRRSAIITDHNFNILGKNVKQKTSIKNLGVIFEDDLNFCAQINSTVAKCGYHIRNLTNLLTGTPSSCWLTPKYYHGSISVMSCTMVSITI